MKLVITEKPQVARDIARVLGVTKKYSSYFEGKGLRITWCFGHMCELKMPEQYHPEWKQWKIEMLPMVPSAFKLNIKKDVKEHWTQVERLLKSSDIDTVVNACDAGREGELIFRYAYQYAKCTKPIERLWISSLEDSAIVQGWKNLRSGADFEALADAARCRSEADWLVGLNATRAMTCLARSGGGDQLLSVGRVQTPTLALIVDRDKQIADFNPETFWKIHATFKKDDSEIQWVGTFFQNSLAKRPSTDSTDKNTDKKKDASLAERLFNKSEAEQIRDLVLNKTGTVSKATRKRSVEKTPLLYDLNSLQQRANQRYGFTAKQTLDLAQSLYETHKLLTYPRTDSRYLTPDIKGSIPSILQALKAVGPYTASSTAIQSAKLRTHKRIFNSKEVGDHHAIIPTSKSPLTGRLKPEEKKIYDLVARRFLAAFSEDALFDLSQIIVDITADSTNVLPNGIQSPLQFRSKGKVCVSAGWQVIDPPSKHTDSLLPDLTKGDATLTISSKTVEGKTRPPNHFTEASLLGSMEKAGRDLEDDELKRAMKGAGLGTPATRASIIENLIRRKYIERKKKNLHATTRGKSLIESVPVEELKSALLTGRWESRLSNMADGTDTREAFMADVARNLQSIVEQIKTANPPKPEIIVNTDQKSLGDCPVCGAPVRKQRTVFKCDRGRACSFIVYGKISTRTISQTMIKELLKNGKTKVVKGFKSQRTGKEFSAALRLGDNNKVVFDFNNPQPNAKPARAPSKSKVAPSALPEMSYPVGMTCPQCAQGRLIQGRAAWGCNRYREGCRFTFTFEQNGELITPQEATKIIQSM
mgnify:CR=1 FL=1